MAKSNIVRLIRIEAHKNPLYIYKYQEMEYDGIKYIRRAKILKSSKEITSRSFALSIDAVCWQPYFGKFILSFACKQ